MLSCVSAVQTRTPKTVHLRHVLPLHHSQKRDGDHRLQEGDWVYEVGQARQAEQLHAFRCVFMV